MSSSRSEREPFGIYNSSGDLIRGDLRYVRDGKKKPVIVICHSFMAFKDWGFFPHVGRKIAEAGYVSIAFNFSQNGVVNDDNRITDFEKFERNTFSKELEDLRAVIDAVTEKRLGEETGNHNELCLLGHSRGGGIAIVHAAADERIKALVTWSAISTFDRWTPHQKEAWKRLGYLPLAKDTSISPLRLGIDLLNDLEQHQDKLNILQAASKVNVPWLIVHGSEDVTVKPHEAERLHAGANKKTTEVKLLEKIGHLYNGASVEEDHYKTLDGVMNLTTTWLQHHLKKE
jgi:dienelactone hydrolase